MNRCIHHYGKEGCRGGRRCPGDWCKAACTQQHIHCCDKAGYTCVGHTLALCHMVDHMRTHSCDKVQLFGATKSMENVYFLSNAETNCSHLIFLKVKENTDTNNLFR